MISIIVPIYKVERYLNKCVDSILSQTYQDIELILIDDGSPDHCPSICDYYKNKDQRIRVVHQKNAGVSAARNAGLRIASGEYIGFVDPDDFIMPDMYESLLQAIESSSAQLAVCGYDYYNEEYVVDQKRKYLCRQNEILSQKELMKRMSDMPPTVRNGVCNKLFHRNLLENIIFKEGMHSSEDVLFLTEYLQRVESAVFVHRPLYGNLVRAGSATHGGLNIQSLSDSFFAHDTMYENTVRLYPELKNHAMAFLLDVCTLKYNEAKEKMEHLNQKKQFQVKKYLITMKRYIHKRARQAVFDKNIYWKTRVYYLFV